MKLRRQASTELWHANARYLSRIVGVFATMGAGNLAGFLGVLLAVRLYSPAALGFAGIALNGAALVNVLANLGVIPLVLRRLGRSEQPHHLMNLAYTIGGSTNLIIALFYSRLIPVGAICGSVECELVARSSFVLLAVGMFFHAAQDSALFALDLSYTAAARTVITQVGRIALIGILAAITQTGVVTAAAVSFGVITLWVQRKVLAPRIGPFRFSLRDWRGLLARDLSYVTVSYLVDCLFWIPGALIPILIAHHLSMGDSGLYYVASLVFSAALLPIIAIVTAELASQSSKDSSSVCLKTLTLTLAAAAVINVVVFVAAPFLPRAFGPEYTGETVLLLRILALAAIPASLKQLYLTHSRLQLSMMPALILFSIWAVGVVSLSWVLMRSNGLEGVGIAIVIMEWLAGSAAALLWWRALRRNDPSFRLRSAVLKAVSAVMAQARAAIGVA